MCNFCDNSGNRKESMFNKNEQSEGNFEMLIYGNKFLRINITECDNSSILRNNTKLRPGTFEIKYCPYCGRKL